MANNLKYLKETDAELKSCSSLVPVVFCCVFVLFKFLKTVIPVFDQILQFTLLQFFT